MRLVVYNKTIRINEKYIMGVNAHKKFFMTQSILKRLQRIRIVDRGEETVIIVNSSVQINKIH